MGKHLIMDISGVEDRFQLTDVTHTYNFLASIPHLVGLQPLGFPIVVQATDKSADGVTGVQLLTTSHASIHTWSNGKRAGQMHIDVFSCDDFDERELLETIQKLYQPESIECKTIRRA
jgi:S-adenosylmethionine/arginine decarboxylase-like enzyme